MKLVFQLYNVACSVHFGPTVYTYRYGKYTYLNNEGKKSPGAISPNLVCPTFPYSRDKLLRFSVAL
jgi:hypothetical protein